MIVYFADRRLSILGLASSDLPTGIFIADDTIVTSIESGTTTFSLDIYFDDQSRKLAESMADAGNYVLYKYGDKDKFFTIIDFEEDIDEHKISIYMEDGGLDLLNDVAYPYYAESEHSIEWYIERYLVNTGFEIKIDEMLDSDKTLQLGWDDTTTVTNRLLSIVTAFEAEMDFGFEIDGLRLMHKYVNVYKKIGKDASVKLRLNRELTNIIVKKSVANLATALDVTGDRDDSDMDLEDVGVIMMGNEYAFGEGSGGSGWVDSFYNQTGCQGYSIRQPGGDFLAKGGENATYPGKNYTECINAFIGSGGSSAEQTKTITVDGPRNYKLSLELKWTVPAGNDPFSVTYELKILSGSYNFAQFAIGWQVNINGSAVNTRARSGAVQQSISKNSSLSLCSGTTSVPRTKSDVSVSASIDMGTNRASDGKAIAPGPMNLSGTFKAVFEDTEEDMRFIRYVIVAGGVNDITPFRAPSGSISNNITNFVNTVKEHFPYASIYFVPLFGTVEGNIDDRTKTPKVTVTRDNYTELDWLTYSDPDHTEAFTNTSGNRGGATTGDIFYVKGQSVDGGWTHTAIYECTNTSGNLAGNCVGHMIDNRDWLMDTWVNHARTLGVFACQYSMDWFKGEVDYRPDRDPVTADSTVSSVTNYYLANSSSETPEASSITSTSIPTLTTTNKYLWRKQAITYSDGSDVTEDVILIAVKDSNGTHVRTDSIMFLNSSGYSTTGSYIARLLAGWNGDVNGDSNGYNIGTYVTLAGCDYDDGDFYVDGTMLKSREAVSKWSRFIDNETAFTDSYHLVRTFSYSTTDQDELLAKAIEELKHLREPETTYEADVLFLPSNVEIGDTIDVVDEQGELFLSSRLLEIEHSETRGEDRITLGEFKRKDSGIVKWVQDLADKFQEQMQNFNFYTWTAYADDDQGTNISVTRKKSSRYLGIATFRLSPTVDLSDPSVFQWTVIDDSDKITITISSSNGTYFANSPINTTLTAFVFVNGDLQTAEEVAELGQINWYATTNQTNGETVYAGSGPTLTILTTDLVNDGNYEARLEG